MAEWVENLHPRAPKGMTGGGRFVSKGGGAEAKTKATGGWQLDAKDRKEIARYRSYDSVQPQERPARLTPEEVSVIERYVRSDASVLHEPESLLVLDNACTRYQLPENTVLHRSFRLADAPGGNKTLASLQPGDVVSDPRFLSASLSPIGSGPQVHILAPKGAFVLPTGYFDEMILPRNTRLEYMGEEPGDGSRYFRMKSLAAQIQKAGKEEKSADIIPFPREEEATARLTPEGTDVGAQKTEADKRLAISDFRRAKIHVATGNEENFVKEWEARVNEDPEEFKKRMLGGYDGTVSVHAGDTQWDFTSSLLDKNGLKIGEYDHSINFRTKVAYLGFIQIDRRMEGKGIGKKILEARVDMLQKLGMKKDTLHANIDVGSYAWAKFGYVPNSSSWPDIASEVRMQLPEADEDEFDLQRAREEDEENPEPESWDTLTDSQQEAVHERWLNDTRSDFFDSEVESWRENDLADESAREVAQDFILENDWAVAALEKLRKTRLENEQPDFPYTNDELVAAVNLKYEGGNGRRDDPTIEFQDVFLRAPSNAPPPEQKMLPGFDRPDLSSHLTDEMRSDIETTLIAAFHEAAEQHEDDVEPPDWLSESANENQEEYWDSMDERDRWHWAESNMEFGRQRPEPTSFRRRRSGIEMDSGDARALRKLAESRDAKALWGIADSKYGKELLMNRHWYGDLNFDDKATMERFKAYVGKGDAEQRRKAA